MKSVAILLTWMILLPSLSFASEFAEDYTDLSLEQQPYSAKISRMTQQELIADRSKRRVEAAMLLAGGGAAAAMVGVFEAIPIVSIAPNTVMFDELTDAEKYSGNPLAGGVVWGILEAGPALSRVLEGEPANVTAFACTQKTCRKNFGKDSRLRHVLGQLKDIKTELENRKRRVEENQKMFSGISTKPRTRLEDPAAPAKVERHNSRAVAGERLQMLE